jgi:hypothetical protein
MEVEGVKFGINLNKQTVMRKKKKKKHKKDEREKKKI